MSVLDRALKGPADRPDAIGGGEEVENQELKEGASLGSVLQFSDRLTRLRNDRYLKTLPQRMTHLSVGGAEILTTFQRVKPESRMREILPDVAATVLLRAMTMLQSLEGREGIIHALKQKYPESGCSYCGLKPCGCEVARPEEKKGAESSEAQNNWSLREWQEHLKSVYGEVNDRRGLNFVCDRLNEEIGEAGAAGLQMDMQPELAEQFRREAISELADTVAWALGVCNAVDTDMEKKFLERYGKGCPNCGQLSCQCGPFAFVHERKFNR